MKKLITKLSKGSKKVAAAKATAATATKQHEGATEQERDHRHALKPPQEA